MVRGGRTPAGCRRLERPPSGPPPGHRRSPTFRCRGRFLAEETLIVLSLSLLASAVFAILSLLEAPLRGVTVACVSRALPARGRSSERCSRSRQWLVVYLVRRSGEGLEGIGMQWDRPRQDIGRGVLLFLVVGAAGIGLYLAAVALGVNRFVVPVPTSYGRWSSRCRCSC